MDYLANRCLAHSEGLSNFIHRVSYLVHLQIIAACPVNC